MSGDFFREANYGSLSATFRQACIDADTRPNKLQIVEIRASLFHWPRQNHGWSQSAPTV
jgi:hypothetical protein